MRTNYTEEQRELRSQFSDARATMRDADMLQRPSTKRIGSHFATVYEEGPTEWLVVVGSNHMDYHPTMEQLRNTVIDIVCSDTEGLTAEMASENSVRIFEKAV